MVQILPFFTAKHMTTGRGPIEKRDFLSIIDCGNLQKDIQNILYEN
jgi:hypothetical protein